MEALPVELTIDIISSLPVKTIIHCKLVCKKWRNLVLDSSFVNLHLLTSSPTTGLIVHQCDSVSLKWVEIEDKASDHHHSRYETIFDLNTIPVLQNSHTSQMGSVNGLICLWQNSPQHDNTYICNPITQEILILPTSQYHKHRSARVGYGFGVSSLTGEYKVVRTLNRFIRLEGNKSKMVSEAEVYTLGTGKWRTLGRVPGWLYGSEVGVVLNDRCHWILSDYEDAPERISNFDLNTETFELFPSPPFEAVEEVDDHVRSLAVLKDCLCMSDGNDAHFTIWVMKEYGIKKSWHKELVIKEETLNPSREQPYWYTIYLVEGLKDGTIFLMTGDLWAFYPTSHTIEEIDTCKGLESVLAYRPSFLKLQDFESERNFFPHDDQNCWNFFGELAPLVFVFSVVVWRRWAERKCLLLLKHLVAVARDVNEPSYSSLDLYDSTRYLVSWGELGSMSPGPGFNIPGTLAPFLWVFPWYSLDPSRSAQSKTIKDAKLFNCYLTEMSYHPNFIKLQNFESERAKRRTLTDTSMEDLPAELTMDILSRLPVKTIIHCKLVCEKWRDIVSDSSFVKLHLSRSPTGLIIHHNDPHICVNPGILEWGK
ncbi:hypothetical protein OSB04_un000222 [Centaurea solstitialis]|uniref:F-box domain-containing protein n=1 Tax=Centaurea solstitialis TaxID=347529 RepID=A0AA38SQU9_9ASTR|nr:hypothetical protein OSB04_un000222 [Centaurea solstitialis]